MSRCWGYVSHIRTVAEGPLVIWRRLIMALWLHTLAFSRGLIKAEPYLWKGKEKRVERKPRKHIFLFMNLFRDYLIEDLLCARHCSRSWSYSSEQNTWASSQEVVEETQNQKVEGAHPFLVPGNALVQTRGLTNWGFLHFWASWNLPLIVLFKLPVVPDNL